MTPSGRETLPLMFGTDVMSTDAAAWRSIGATRRIARPGPEAELIERFLANASVPITPDHRATIFREPRLDSGFPDVVVVVWCAETTRAWPRERAALQRQDLRVVQLLQSIDGADEARLRRVWPRVPYPSLARLEAAGLIERSGRWWCARALSETFAVREIFAFEAKVSAWRDAIAQATLNRWFATRSYVLLPSIPRGAPVVEAARGGGVGLWVQQGSASVERARPRRAAVPRSYASWLFNEWAWRLAALDGA